MASYLLQADVSAPIAVADVQPPASADVPSAVGAAMRRLSVYHHAYRARLLDTLRDTYGHTLRMLGDEVFDALALAYIEANPSERGNLRWYGQTWPEALQVEDVAELARLDWALREAFDGPDDAVLALSDLQQLPPEAWSVVRLRPHATVRCLRLAHNTLARWHALDEERQVPAAEALPEPGCLLVWRRGERPHFRSMAAPEAWAVQQLVAGATWDAVCEGLAETWPDDDVATLAAQCLRRWLDEGVLAKVLLPA